MCRGCKPDLGLLPMLTAIIMAAGIITTYSIAVGLGHVSALLPSISDTGIMSPEMHIFSQVLNIVAVMSLATFVLRYKMIHSLLDEEDSARLLKLTRINLVTGCIASLGLSIVGNFQDNTSAIVHLVGAFMVFLLGNCYMILDAIVTYKMHPKYNGIRVFGGRLFLGVFGLTAFMITVIGASVANKNSIFSSTHQRLHWGPDDPGYAAHLVSTFGEWFMGLSFICYYFTYIRDFGKFGAELRIDMKVGHLDQMPLSDEDETKSGLDRASRSGSQQGGPNERTGLLT